MPITCGFDFDLSMISSVMSATSPSCLGTVSSPCEMLFNNSAMSCTSICIESATHGEAAGGFLGMRGFGFFGSTGLDFGDCWGFDGAVCFCGLGGGSS